MSDDPESFPTTRLWNRMFWTFVQRLAVDLASSIHVRQAEWRAGVLLRKEVIQPQVPLRLPCYDFIPITSHTLGKRLLAVSNLTSGTTGFHDVTGSVYKARERIHGAVADAPLLAIPTSWRRVAASNPNWAHFSGISFTSRLCDPL